MAHNFFNLQNISFLVIVLSIIFVAGFSSVQFQKLAWATPCTDCLSNNAIQILTIFIHRNEEYPYLAGNSTVMIYPNPLAHTLNATVIDPSLWGRGLLVADDGPLDSDLTPGVIELVGVNNGTYGIFQLKNAPSGLLNDEPVSADVQGIPGSVGIVNYLLNATTITNAIFLSPPLVSETIIDSLAGFGATVNGFIIASAEDLPPAKVVAKASASSATSPTPLIFSSLTNSPTDASSLYANMRIPAYGAPGTEGTDTAFFPPMFKVDDNNGNSLVMTPLLDKISAGTDLHLRLDNAEIGAGHPPIDEIFLPLATDSTNVGIRIQVNNNIPAGFPASPASGSTLFIDVDTIGDLDLGNPTTFSGDPQIMYNVSLNSDSSCPPSTVYLYEPSGNHWHPLDTLPVRNPSADTTHTCAYIQSVTHFSSYLISGASSSGTHDHSSGHSHSGDMGGMHSDHDMLSMIVQQLDIQQISYNVCGLNLARIVVATNETSNLIHVTINGDKSGLLNAQYSAIQIYAEEYNPYHVDKKYVYDAPLSKNEDLFNVTVSDKQYALHKTVKITGDICTGSIDHISTNPMDLEFGKQLYDGYEVLDQTAHAGHTMSGGNNMEGMDNPQNMTQLQPQTSSPESGLMNMNNPDDAMTNMTSQGSDMMNMKNQGNGIAPMLNQQTLMFEENENEQLPVKYFLEGEILGMEVNQDSKSLVLHLSGVVGGEFVIEIPRKLVDDANGKLEVHTSTNELISSGAGSTTYQSKSMTLDYNLSNPTIDTYTLKMVLPKNANTLTVFGTSVIPEFGPMVTIVLVVSITSIIILSRMKNNFP